MDWHGTPWARTRNMPQTDSSMNQAERLSAVQEPGGTQDPGRLCMNKQISEWMTGDRSRLRADAVVVCNAISKDKMLSRRICRYVDDQQQWPTSQPCGSCSHILAALARTQVPPSLSFQIGFFHLYFASCTMPPLCSLYHAVAIHSLCNTQGMVPSEGSC